MRIALLLVTIFLAAPVWGSCELSSARIGNLLLKVGDSERRVLEQQPSRTIQLQTREGGAAGIRYDFYQRGKTVQVYVRGGRITRICHINE